MAHTCHADDCTVEVPRKMFMCRKHWFMLPKPLQDAVWREYTPGQELGQAPVTKAYLKVTDEAIRYVAELEAKKAAQAAAATGQLSLFREEPE